MTSLTTRGAARILIMNLRHRHSLLLTRLAVLLGEGRPDTRERRKSSLLGDPHFFFRRSLPFLILFIILKKTKDLYLGSFRYFSYTIRIGSSWYMNTGVRDLEVAFFRANSTWIYAIGSKNLSNRPIFVVLNTDSLDMIRQLKFMPIVMNPARIASSDWKS